MRISVRILLGYFLIVGLAGYFVLTVFLEEVKPGVRQAMEDSLVDSANLLAELAEPDLREGRIAEGGFARALAAYRARVVDAQIWGIRKRGPEFRVYLTDARGFVVFDSDGVAVGQDYSRWNDVRLTLQGRYGARSTVADPARPESTVMHVAAPVRDGGRIIGSLTVAKPNEAVQPFVERAQARIRAAGWLLLGLAAIVGLWFSWRLGRSIEKLRSYARAVAEGERAEPPHTRALELDELGRALERMREKLDGKQYVEDYVHALTHELKSPLSAIRGAAELLLEPGMAPDARDRFAGNIRDQSLRMQRITDRMLQLAAVEHRQGLQDVSEVDLDTLAREAAAELAARRPQEPPCIMVEGQAGRVRGERFLLFQALTNLLENAADFSPVETPIRLLLTRGTAHARLQVIDRGSGIPDYARDKVFERFYSLPRPAGGSRSSGLGLAFVREVAQLHQGSIRLEPGSGGGTVATLEIALAPA